MKPLLSVQSLSKIYHHRIGWFRTHPQYALKDVSFELHAGQSIAIMGTNGSGKSTLASVLAGAVRPTSGVIEFQGAALSFTNYQQRAQHIRMVFQDSEGSLNPHLTIGRQLEEPLLFNTKLSEQQRSDLIKRTLLKVGLLDEHRVFYPYMMSNGQRQRVCIARAIILNPSILVADEALATLDSSVRAQIINLLLDLQDEFKMSYIFITHSPEIAQHMADDILLLRDGERAEYGPIAKIMQEPDSDYARQLLQINKSS